MSHLHGIVHIKARRYRIFLCIKIGMHSSLARVITKHSRMQECQKLEVQSISSKAEVMKLVSYTLQD